MRVERLQVQVAGVRQDHPERERSEDSDLEGAKDDTGRRRDADVAVRQQVDDRGHNEHPDPPLARVVPAGLARHHLAHRPAELEVEERRDEWLEEDEEPGDVEPGPRAERARRIGVEAACRWFELRQLTDRDRRTKAGDQSKQNGERQRLFRRRHRDVDRVGDGRSWCHVGDRLEQHLRQSNRVQAQPIEG